MSYPSKTLGALHLALLKVLRCIVCPACGCNKEEKKPLCKSCYWALQPPLRTLLFAKVDEGDGEFEDYYLKALADLKRRGLTRAPEHWNPKAQNAIAATGLFEALKAFSEAK